MKAKKKTVTTASTKSINGKGWDQTAGYAEVVPLAHHALESEPHPGNPLRMFKQTVKRMNRRS